MAAGPDMVVPIGLPSGAGRMARSGCGRGCGGGGGGTASWDAAMFVIGDVSSGLSGCIGEAPPMLLFAPAAVARVFGTDDFDPADELVR